MRTLLLVVSIAVVAVMAAWGAASPIHRPSVQQRCFPPGTVGVEDFDNCPDAHYGELVDV